MDYFKIEINLIYDDVNCDQIETRDFVLRKLKLKTLKNLIHEVDEDYESGVIVVDDLLLYTKSFILFLCLRNINGQGVKYKIRLNADEWKRIESIVDKLAK